MRKSADDGVLGYNLFVIVVWKGTVCGGKCWNLALWEREATASTVCAQQGLQHDEKLQLVVARTKLNEHVELLNVLKENSHGQVIGLL
jgi:hypothetical protein